MARAVLRPGNRMMRTFLLLTLAASILFIAWPGLDLEVSSWFYATPGGFWRASDPFYSWMRDLIRWSGHLALIAALCIGLANLRLGARQKTGWRVWLFGVASGVLGPGLLVNGILKPLVGRARPADLVEFGGSRAFTPAYRIADQCVASCSFTSGEAALVAAVAVPILLVLWPSLGRSGRAWLLGLAALYIATGSGLRVAMGRHFLSDVVLSVLFSTTIALILYRVMGIAAARARFVTTDIGDDLRRILAALWAGIAGLWRQ